MNTYVQFEHKNVIEHRYSWSKRQLKLVSFIGDYCNGTSSSVFYVMVQYSFWMNSDQELITIY